MAGLDIPVRNTIVWLLVNLLLITTFLLAPQYSFAYAPHKVAVEVTWEVDENYIPEFRKNLDFEPTDEEILAYMRSFLPRDGIVYVYSDGSLIRVDIEPNADSYYSEILDITGHTQFIIDHNGWVVRQYSIDSTARQRIKFGMLDSHPMDMFVDYRAWLNESGFHPGMAVSEVAGKRILDFDCQAKFIHGCPPATNEDYAGNGDEIVPFGEVYPEYSGIIYFTDDVCVPLLMIMTVEGVVCTWVVKAVEPWKLNPMAFELPDEYELIKME